MSSKKGAVPIGKGQPPNSGPGNAAHKKMPAKSASTGRCSSGKKSRKPGHSFASLKARQAVVEHAKCEVWASVLSITDVLISSALSGNIAVAKALFDFAGVYSLPEPEAQTAASTLLPPSGGTSCDPVDTFFRSIGIEPASDEAEPKAEANAMMRPQNL